MYIQVNKLVYNLLYCIGIPVPANIRVTVLTPRRVKVTWDQYLSSLITGYIISFTTTALYTSGGSVRVDSVDNTSYILDNLEEGTLYTITVQATTINNETSANSNEVSVRTYTDSK